MTRKRMSKKPPKVKNLLSTGVDQESHGEVQGRRKNKEARKPMSPDAKGKTRATASEQRMPYFRIIAGRYRGMRLSLPPSSVTRPAKDNVKEAIFNKLTWLAKPDGTPLIPRAVVLDIFAGSGSMGFEALSRGADRVIMVDNHPRALAVMASNVARLGPEAEDRVTLVKTSALSMLQLPKPAMVDLAFVDPPYFQNLVEPVLNHLLLGGWLKAGAVVVTEMDAREPFVVPKGYTMFDDRSYGRLVIRYLRLGA